MDNNKNHLPAILITFLFLITIIFSDLFAGTSGKIAGRVIDKKTNEPLAGVNIIISNTMLGASTDENGEFFILNITPGIYEVQFLYVGYKTHIIKNVNVQVDLTTLLDIEIEQQALEGETIVVTAVRPVIQKDATATATVISARDFKEVPVENFKAIVQTKAGVTKDKDGNLHIRGSRSNEILYIIDGVPVNNAFDNQVSLNVSTNAIEELSVIIGAFNAEYGKAMSGIINIVTKEGTKKFTGNVSFQTGDMLSSNQDIFTNIQTYDPLNAYEIEGNLSGYFPFLLKDKLSFSTSCRYYKDDGYLYGVREYKATTKEPGEEAQLIKGDSVYISMNPNEELNFHAKLKLFISPSIKLTYSNLYRKREYQNYVHSRYYAPYGQLRHFNNAVQNSIGFNHLISHSTLYTLNLSYTYDEKEYYAYDNPVDSRYDWWAQLEQWRSFSSGANGARNKDIAKDYYVKFDFLSQINKRQQIKIGADARILDLNHHYYEVSRTDTSDYVQILTGRVNDKYQLYPYEFSAYAQDKIELEEMVINVGIRFDYFNPNADAPVNYDDLVSSETEKVDPKYQISPRLSVAHLVSENSKIYYSFGHFIQMPPYNRLFCEYEAFNEPLVEIRTGILSTIIGNPNLKPQQTVSYEVGYEQKLSDVFSIFIKGYYKNIKNLLDTEIYQLPNGTFYAAYVNRDYGNIRGFSISLNKSLSNYFMGSIDYTFQQARGNSSNPNQVYLNARSDAENLKKLVPLDWDQPHAIRINLQVVAPKGFGSSLLGIIESGYPYSHKFQNKSITADDVNRAKKPTQINFDLHLYKTFKFKYSDNKFNTRLYIKVYNLFNNLNENSVWSDTGTAKYTLNDDYTEDWIRHPHWYSKPRTIFTGVEFNF